MKTFTCFLICLGLACGCSGCLSAGVVHAAYQKTTDADGNPETDFNPAYYLWLPIVFPIDVLFFPLEWQMMKGLSQIHDA